MKRLLACVVVALLGFETNAWAESGGVLAICGESKGQAYYFVGGAVPLGQGGWQADGINNGVIVLAILPDGKYDIIMKDARNEPYSSAKSGLVVVPLAVSARDNKYLISVMGNGVSENYLFKVDSKGAGILAWSSTKTNDYISKVSVMTSVCLPEEVWTKAR